MLEVRGISKAYPGVQSLRNVDLSVAPGEVHALLGENGAGKSTLVRVVAGAVRADEGVVSFDGSERAWSSPKDAIRAGLHVVYQEFAQFPRQCVADNIFAGRERRTRWRLLDHKRMHAEAALALADLGISIETRRLAGSLSVAEQQMVEIARALVHEVKLLVLDEPTAVLGERESELLLRQVLRLKERGVAILYISHRLQEVKSVCDSATILKDGALVARVQVPDTSIDQMVSMMVGREVHHVFPPRVPTKPTVSNRPAARLIGSRTRNLKGVDLTVHAGEILGIGGLPDSGALDIAYILAGAALLDAGTLEMAGEPRSHYTVKSAIGDGVGFVNEDRKRKGLLAALDLAANLVAADLDTVSSRGVISASREGAQAERALRKYRIAGPGPRSDVFHLSGGNQQKLLVARWSRVARHMLVLAEPTRGVDVGARSEVYRWLAAMAAEGLAVVVFSSDLPELLGLASRVVVFRQGRIAGELDPREATEVDFMHLASIR